MCSSSKWYSLRYCAEVTYSRDLIYRQANLLKMKTALSTETSDLDVLLVGLSPGPWSCCVVFYFLFLIDKKEQT